MWSNMKNILVTGAAGFIGYHTCRSLLERGDNVIGFDNLNDYYDVALKQERLKQLEPYENFIFVKGDLTDFDDLEAVFQKHKIDVVCNLAAQVGVRNSIIDPFAYQKSNIEGFLNIIEFSKRHNIDNFVYASSSSVYGNNKKVPFSESDPVDNPISIYAATKKADELMAHSYSHLFKLNCTGLRFFTVYGPWGRPDMAVFKFTRAIIAGDEIELYNFGNMKRDFTYIDDIVQGIVASIDNPMRYGIFNLGNSNTVELEYLVKCLEKELGIMAKKKLLPLQAGDMLETFADVSSAREKLGFEPKIGIEDGIRMFVEWYRSYIEQHKNQ
ncbi:MAG: SDR family NAD(P)-dependent oxidoreductase [ANME-2 cluster archaeon]|nr:MAG: SDR family NAD(P)-dependent oxidoreductase [ANME-2 cluster archaeon]